MNNKGDISKTFKDMGSKSSVKSLVTSMAIGGALSGFDAAIGGDSAAKGAKTASTTSARLPQLSHGDWSKVAQRVAGQSIISSSLNTAINGGSFKDNLATALLTSVGSQLHAEGAHLIGDNGAVLGVSGKALSHALVAGVAAEIGGGNAKGAAAGALAAELAGVVMGDNLIGPQQWQEKAERQAQITRFFGGVAGAVFTGKAEGAYSGASAAETAFRYNYLSHHQQKLMETEMAAAKTLADKGSVFVHWGLTSATQDGAFAAGIVAGVPEGVHDSAIGLLGVLKEPKQTFMALKELINSDDVLGTVAQSVKQDWLGRIARMEAHYQQAGTRGAFDSGREAGKLLVEYGGYAVGAGALAKGSPHIAAGQVKKFRGKGPTVHPVLLNELATNGVKFTPENVLAVARTPSGQIVFLEKGSATAGLRHIVAEHGSQFAKIGISEVQIPRVVMKAVTDGKIVGYQGSGIGRPIYETVINGQKYNMAITVGNNGYIVGANLRGAVK